MRRAVLIVLALSAATSAALAADLSDDAVAPTPAASAGEVTVVNGRPAPMIDLVMGAATVGGYSVKSKRYLAPDASILLKMAPGSPCEQTAVAKFNDGATVRRAVDVCRGPVVIR